MKPSRSDLLQGTLDLLVLKTLALGAQHGWGISQRQLQLLQAGAQVEEQNWARMSAAVGRVLAAKG